MTPTAQTLVQLLRRQAEKYGDKVAVAYSDNGDDDGLTQLTYAELDRRARAIGAELQARGATGQRVLVFCRPGLEHLAGFFGCWYAGAVVVPVHESLPPRLSWVIPDAQPAFALVAADAPARLKAEVDLLVRMVGDEPMRWLLTSWGDPAAWTAPEPEPDATAILHYTSGTVVAPKGILVSHRNVLCNVDAVLRTWGGDDSAIGVSWLSQEQNMGLISQFIAVIYCGATGFGMSAQAFRERPMRWLEAVSRRRAISTSAPSHAYPMCVAHSTPAERAALDLSGLIDVSAGARAARFADLKDFIEAFAPAGLRPEAFSTSYGLSEATSTVSGGSSSVMPTVVHLDGAALAADRLSEAAPDGAQCLEVVSSGPPVDGQLIVIVDPETRLECEPDQVGEIWIAGPHVVQGYWGRPEETEQTFNAFLAGTGEGPFLRTGDLGFLRAGELFITGRCADLLTIVGGNHYPDSIEATVQAAHPALLARRGAAFTTNPGTGTGERLIVAQEIDRDRVGEAELAQIAAAARAAVTARHGLEIASLLLVPAGGLSTTTLGKIQRGRCCRQFLDHTLDTIAEWHAPEPPPARGANLGQAMLRQDITAARARRSRDVHRQRARTGPRHTDKWGSSDAQSPQQ